MGQATKAGGTTQAVNEDGNLVTVTVTSLGELGDEVGAHDHDETPAAVPVAAAEPTPVSVVAVAEPVVEPAPVLAAAPVQAPVPVPVPEPAPVAPVAVNEPGGE